MEQEMLIYVFPFFSWKEFLTESYKEMEGFFVVPCPS